MKAKSTLAVEKQTQLIRYMVTSLPGRLRSWDEDVADLGQEWKSYKSPLDSAHREAESESDILELADFLGLKNRPSAFRVLPCLGIFRDEPKRFAFIFQPPSYIERIPGDRLVQGQVSGSRLPRTLQDLLEEGSRRDGSPEILPLGSRFRLACSLAESLYVMHATGWVHKK